MKFKKVTTIFAVFSIMAVFMSGCGVERSVPGQLIETQETLPVEENGDILNPTTYLPIEKHPFWENYKFKMDFVEYEFPFDYHKLEESGWERAPFNNEVIYNTESKDSSAHKFPFQRGKSKKVKNAWDKETKLRAHGVQSVTYHHLQYGNSDNSMMIELLFFNHSNLEKPLSECNVETVFLRSYNIDETCPYTEYEEAASVPIVDLQYGRDSIGFGTRDYSIVNVLGEPHKKENVEANLNKWVYYSKNSTLTFFFRDGYGVCGIRMDQKIN